MEVRGQGCVNKGERKQSFRETKERRWKAKEKRFGLQKGNISDNSHSFKFI